MFRSLLQSIAVALFVSALTTVIATAQSPTLPSKDWPTTIDDVVHDILSNMSDEEKMQIRITRREGLGQLHYGLVTGIHNRYGLWNGNKKLIVSACGHPCRPEEASTKIIEALWDELQK
jgi:hypothetical protein